MEAGGGGGEDCGSGEGFEVVENGGVVGGVGVGPDGESMVAVAEGRGDREITGGRMCVVGDCDGGIEGG